MKHKVLQIEQIFNKDSVGIFTDASMDNTKKCACAGAVIVHDDFTTSYVDVILNDATVNRAELIGIKLGIEEGLKLKKKNINIFSDSLLSINSLRHWIFKWSDRSEDGILINSNNKPVVNMDIIYDIVELIYENKDTNINLFHQKGHISLPGDYTKVAGLFRRTNDGYQLSKKFATILKTYNDMVDYCTRNNLRVRNTVNREKTLHYSMFDRPTEKRVVQGYKPHAKISLRHSI